MARLWRRTSLGAAALRCSHGCTTGPALRALLHRQEVAALGTLHKGEPFVSMVPYALLPDGALVVHVSRLATHTRDMEEYSGVSVLVLAERAAGEPAQALARATLQADAQPLAPDAPGYAAARDAYLARFPASEPMFGFADFSLFRLVPRSARFVGGFAQAGSLTAAQYARLMSSASTAP
jgi:putative heme iron utilization protein